MEWKDLTIGQFKDLVKIEEIENEAEKAATALSIITGNDVSVFYEMELSDYYKEAEKLLFLSESPEPEMVKEEYSLNGHKYRININVMKMSAGQFIDYTDTLRKDPENYSLLLAILLTPKGKKYGEGYEPVELAKEFQGFNFIDAFSICFFFLNTLKAYSAATVHYLQRTLKKEKKKERDPQMIKKIEETIENITTLLDGLLQSGK